MPKAAQPPGSDPEEHAQSDQVVAFPRSPKQQEEQRPSHNLPLELSSFVGREQEIADVKRLLIEEDNNRLLTLTGPGGGGKTRLALAVAFEVVENFAEDGVWLVELASLSDPDLVPQAVTSTLGVREQPGRSLTATLVDALRPRRMLLILDNCEHLIEVCAALSQALLRTCPELRILATSREALGVAGERVWLVPSLSLPDLERSQPVEELARYEAVRLFLERAAIVASRFELTERNAPAVAQVCQRLDGIPLAIELAAARMRVLTVEQISETLEDPLGLLTKGSRTAAPRHRTLRTTLQWSCDLLTEAERALFGRLAVFVGGFTLEAVEAIGTGEPVEAGEVLDLLSQLVDKSLVVVEALSGGTLRYRMLEPIRQFGLEKLREREEEPEVLRRHAAFFVTLAEEAYPKLRAEPQVEWLGRLEKENANLRGALSWVLSAGEIATAARLGFALWPFWWIRNRQPEGRRWMEQVLLERDELPPPLRIRATIAASTMAYGQGDSESSLLPYAVELEELSRAVGGNALAEAHAHAGVGLLAAARGDFEAATGHLEKVLPLYREAGEDGLAAQTHVWLGTVLLLWGDHEGARQRFEEGLALGRGIGDRLSICNALFNLAQLTLARGDHEEASRRFAEGIAPSEELGDRGNTAYILEGLGIVAGAQGEAVHAARLLGASEALFSAIGLRGHTYYQFDRALYERIEAGVRSTLGEAAFEATFSEGRAMAPERAIEYALEQPMAPDEEEEAQPSAAGIVVPREDDRPSAAGTAALRIFALGAARVEKEGRPVDSPDWIYKSRELLYYLLSHPEGRTREQIGLALWPEASTSQLRSSFHDTVYRLRRALGAKEWIVFEKGRYAFNRSLAYSFDVEAFEQNLSEAQRLENEAPQQAIGHLQEVAELYRGDFLEDLVDSEWAMVRQEELRRAYGDALLLLGRLLFVQERYVEAAEAYRKAISHDDLMEESHRQLMRCYAAMGERGRAIRHYEELVELLYEQLGTAPAPETRTLYERLRAGEEV